MIKGIGIDILETARMKELLSRNPRITTKLLTPLERERFQSLSDKRQVEFVAGRFAAKEALSKALGTGVGARFQWHDVSILTDGNGAPYVAWHKPIYSGMSHLSISHSRHYVVAQVVIEEKNRGMSS